MKRASFEHGLSELRQQIMTMGDMVEKALRQAVEAHRQRQIALARSVIDNDPQINRDRFNVEERALTLIATQAPVAHDLREIAAIMYIATELERMGDHAKGIARIYEMMQDQPPIKPLVDIPKMADKCCSMLNEAMVAFTRFDPSSARQIATQDDVLDDLYNRIYLDLIEIMTKDATKINGATYLLWVAHNLERFGDRTVNICERIIFVATGESVEISTHRNG